VVASQISRTRLTAQAERPLISGKYKVLSVSFPEG